MLGLRRALLALFALGVIFAGVMPRRGVIDRHYLDRIAADIDDGSVYPADLLRRLGEGPKVH